MSESKTKAERLVAIVRRWADLYQGVCELAQQRPITTNDFDAISELVAVDKFKRTGIYKDEADWPLCLEKYLQFSGSSTWRGKVRFMHVVENVVFQELEETITRAQGENVIYTMSVYEFDENEKVTALRVYMQQAQDNANVLILGEKGR
ncbi:hypothetical protein [Halioxenophilus sp. WMMB6]|uniref:hypothetical protein n=1 Tax=Halioxenophilus sp. WMMB6 TaxID=3073815 RepID=UPI00295EB92E|nr:hypothetical protein [Halioxenophilus sp. WMMB6]